VSARLAAAGGVEAVVDAVAPMSEAGIATVACVSGGSRW
jgi:hypothetical protein